MAGDERRAQAQRTTIGAFSRALSQGQAHVLADRPDLLWQQLHNRLQWEDDEGVTRVSWPQFARRSATWGRALDPDKDPLLGIAGSHQNPHRPHRPGLRLRDQPRLLLRGLGE